MLSFGSQPSARTLARIEENKGIIANPPAVAAGVIQPRLNTQGFADPADRVVDLARSYPRRG